MTDEPARSYAALSTAYEQMSANYNAAPQRIGPWRAGTGLIIAKKDLDAGRVDAAEAWYRRVLYDEPFHEETTLKLAELLQARGRPGERQELCQRYELRTGREIAC